MTDQALVKVRNVVERRLSVVDEKRRNVVDVRKRSEDDERLKLSD